MAAVPGVDLTAIRDKVRRVTKSPSVNQLTQAELDDYINTFYLYDFPEHLRLINLRETFTITTEPNVDIYNFTPNTIVSIQPPVFVAGQEIFFSQSREEYFTLYPEIYRNEILDTGTAAIGAGPYAGNTIGFPVKQNRVLLSTVDVNGNSMTATDAAVAGTFAGDVVAGSTINYDTGAIATLTWTAAVGVGEAIRVQYVNYQAARPQAALFYDDTIQLTPVPDQAYEVRFDAFVTPTALANGTDEPELREWWQLLAYGASLKIFADRLDMESYAKVNILFDNQKRLIERRTLQQLKVQRTATIYTDEFPRPNPFRLN